MYPYIHVHTTAGCNLFCLFTEREVDELIEELLNPVSTFTCIHVHAKYRHTCTYTCTLMYTVLDKQCSKLLIRYQ